MVCNFESGREGAPSYPHAELITPRFTLALPRHHVVANVAYACSPAIGPVFAVTGAAVFVAE